MAEVKEMRDIGKNIRELRCAKGLTQEELGERLHVTRQTVSNYENGRTRPDIDMLLDIAAALDTDSNSLLYGTPQMENRRREYRRLAVSAGLFLILFICYKLLRPEILKIQAAYFIVLPGLLLSCTLKPMYMLSLGWSAVQALTMILKAKPLDRPWVKYARRVLLGLIGAIALFLLPVCIQMVTVSISSVYGVGPGAFLEQRGYVNTAVYMAMYVAACYYVYAALGAALWVLGFPAVRKTGAKEEGADGGGASD